MKRVPCDDTKGCRCLREIPGPSSPLSRKQTLLVRELSPFWRWSGAHQRLLLFILPWDASSSEPRSMLSVLIFLLGCLQVWELTGQHPSNILPQLGSRVLCHCRSRGPRAAERAGDTCVPLQLTLGFLHGRDCVHSPRQASRAPVSFVHNDTQSSNKLHQIGLHYCGQTESFFPVIKWFVYLLTGTWMTAM